MANGGWYGTPQEWERIEAPIKMLDLELERFVSAHGLSVTRNHKDWPDRSIVWDTGTRCLIQLYLADAETLGINFWICASQDGGRDRFWKQEFLCKEATLDDVTARLPELLNTAKTKLDGWAFATKIAKI